MKFRNYKNSFNNSNRIFSEDDVLDMTLRTLFDKENDVLAQNRAIGMPTQEELKSSSNVVWVEEYVRDDGTKVCGHWRSKPENDSEDNSAFQQADLDGGMTGGASDLEQDGIKKQEVNEKLYPEEIAGVKRGKAMSFEEAGGDNVNPDYYSGNSEDMNNCQSCVVAFEARRRGYDVQAAKQVGYGKTEELSNEPFGAWLDNKTKEPCEGIVIEEKSGKECFDLLNRTIKKGERYAFSYCYSYDLSYEDKQDGHIVVLDRNNEGKLRFYDPQDDIIREDFEIIEKFDTIVDFSGKKPHPRMLRIDDKEFNPYYIHEVVRKHY